MRKIIFFLSVTLFSVLFFINANAENAAIGMVLTASGKVYAENKAVVRTLNRRSEVYPNDVIVTGADGKVQVRFNDDSIIVLQPTSKFAVHDFRFQESKPRDNKFVGDLSRGVLLMLSGKGASENYQLKTPLAALTFRGTGIMGRLITKGNKVVRQDIYVFKGAVEVETLCPEELKEIGVKCEPKKADLFAGEKQNGISVNAHGQFEQLNINELMNTVGNKTIIRQNGGVNIQCGS
jgi:hypothetical protein